MIPYKCKKTLFLNEYDADGFCTERQIEVEEGSTWHIDEDSTYNEIAGVDAIRLVNDKVAWVELYPDTIENHFTKLVNN